MSAVTLLVSNYSDLNIFYFLLINVGLLYHLSVRTAIYWLNALFKNALDNQKNFSEIRILAIHIEIVYSKNAYHYSISQLC